MNYCILKEGSILNSSKVLNGPLFCFGLCILIAYSQWFPDLPTGQRHRDPSQSQVLVFPREAFSCPVNVPPGEAEQLPSRTGGVSYWGGKDERLWFSGGNTGFH